MPEHTSFFTFLFAKFPALAHNFEGLKRVGVGDQPLSGGAVAEPIFASAFVVLLLIVLALIVRGKVKDYAKSVIPDEKLTLRTFFELVVGYFYDLMKEMMGAKKAKRYFPLIGTAACFILFSNFLGFIPGFLPPTSTWTITAGCALIVFVMFNYYGIKENGLGYFKHLAGPVWWLAWLIFPLELLSLFLRPLTLSIRLMLNMTVDHILLSLALGAFALFVPLPIMMLGTLIAVVQVLVFCLLSSIYITLATEHEEHGAGDGHEHGHGKKAQAGEAHA